MEFVEDFRELKVYQLSRQLSLDIFEVTKVFPREEMYSLTDQVRRSSRSIGAQIAESWGKRLYEKHFISKLSDAFAEQMETKHWLETARDCSYLSIKQSDDLTARCEVVGRMVYSMMMKSHLFCRNVGRESAK